MEKLRLTWLLFWAVSPIAWATGPMYDDTPPALPFYLHRLPAKSLEDIYAEAQPPMTPTQRVDFREKVMQLPGEMAVRSPAELTGELNNLLAAARQDYGPQEWSGPGLVNLLQDFLDLVSDGSDGRAEWKSYAEWRLQHLDWFGFIPGPNPATTDANAFPVRAAELEAQLAKASVQMQPHWMYLRGALGFKSGEDTESQQWFEQVVERYPMHPRAEAALFMDGRCQVSRTRTNSNREENIQRAAANRPRAEALLKRYLQQYPNGRFAGDAIGWLGAVAYDSGRYLEALEFYLRQTELPAHPELLRPALTMCERILVRIASKPDPKAFAEVAAHPRLAMALIYLVVNTTEADNFDGKYDNPETVKRWRLRILPALAAAVSDQQSRYAQEAWKPRYLTILALAASNQGKQDQALTLVGMAGKVASDDLSFARAVILQRAGKVSEALTAFQFFLEHFPDSPLARGARLRLALALQDDHQAGSAIVELMKLLPSAPAPGDAQNKGGDQERDAIVDQYPPAGANDSDAEPEQVRQLIDTLSNFAPLKELDAVAGRTDVLAASQTEIRAILAERYLAAEQFTEAEKYAALSDWQQGAARIEKLTGDVLHAQDPSEKASACAQVADAWAKARGRLLGAPLDTEDNRSLIFGANAENANLQRRQNATALGTASEVDEVLESRDELRHAYRWWLKAADADPGSTTAAASLWQALKALPQIADVSSYTLQRALATGAAAESRKLYDRLRKEFPQSREATQFAVYWTFPVPPPADELPGWRDPNYSGRLTFEDAFGLGDDSPENGGWPPLIARLKALQEHAGDWDSGRLAAEAGDLAKRVRQIYQSINDDYILNFLDDLGLFLRQPNLAPEVRKRYIDLRFACMRQSVRANPSELKGADASSGSDPDADLRKQIAAALSDPNMRTATDYLEFLDLAVVANHLIDVEVPGRKIDDQPFTYRARDYALVDKRAVSFLQRYPQSARREAAALLHARAVFMLSYPRRFKELLSWPDGGRWGGSIHYWTNQREPFDPSRVSAALNSYDHDFPNGRYAAEIRSYRADVLLRTRRWSPGLAMTITQLDDQSKPDLRLAAARRLAILYDRLADENDRAELLSLIRANKRASNLLVSYLNIDWAWHPLLYLKSYLTDQTGGAIRTKATEENKGSQPSPGAGDSPPRETDPPYPGERYPQTRARFLTKTEVAALSYAQLRYAINEMYARRGATFPSEPAIRAQFQKFPWYHPVPTLTVEQIEASFSETEKGNLELLGQLRDLKRR